MNERLRLTGKQLLRALRKLGFEVVRVKGSHHFVRHPDGRSTTVPVHSGETLGPGVMVKILHDVDVSRNELKAVM